MPKKIDEIMMRLEWFKDSSSCYFLNQLKKNIFQSKFRSWDMVKNLLYRMIYMHDYVSDRPQAKSHFDLRI
jgi:thioredoxin-related protein